MARIVVSALADADVEEILATIAREAGLSVALEFNRRFDRLYELIGERPALCQSRPVLGPHIRVGVVYPYLVIYRYLPGSDLVSVLRILHGRRELKSSGLGP